MSRTRQKDRRQAGPWSIRDSWLLMLPLISSAGCIAEIGIEPSYRGMVRDLMYQFNKISGFRNAKEIISSLLQKDPSFIKCNWPCRTWFFQNPSFYCLLFQRRAVWVWSGDALNTPVSCQHGGMVGMSGKHCFVHCCIDWLCWSAWHNLKQMVVGTVCDAKRVNSAETQG